MGLLLPTRIGEGSLWCGKRCLLPLFAGRFFSTRVMGRVAVFGVERICGSCARVLFLIPVQLWDAFVRVVWTDR